MKYNNREVIELAKSLEHQIEKYKGLGTEDAHIESNIAVTKSNLLYLDELYEEMIALKSNFFMANKERLAQNDLIDLLELKGCDLACKLFSEKENLTGKEKEDTELSARETVKKLDDSKKIYIEKDKTVAFYRMKLKDVWERIGIKANEIIDGLDYIDYLVDETYISIVKNNTQANDAVREYTKPHEIELAWTLMMKERLEKEGTLISGYLDNALYSSLWSENTEETYLNDDLYDSLDDEEDMEDEFGFADADDYQPNDPLIDDLALYGILFIAEEHSILNMNIQSIKGQIKYQKRRIRQLNKKAQ